jgi:hypothetical protein
MKKILVTIFQLSVTAADLSLKNHNQNTKAQMFDSLRYEE